MDVRERVEAVLSGEEPDRIPLIAFDSLKHGSPGGWVRRLAQRGMGIVRRICPYRPSFNFPSTLDLWLPTVEWIKNEYIEDGHVKIRFTLKTPVGEATSVISIGASETGQFIGFNRDEFFIKSRADWRIFTYLFKTLKQFLRPNYEEMEREKDTLGETGIVIGYLTKTSFPRAWIQLASTEQAVIDFHDKPEDLLEFLNAEKEFQRKAAEITAACPVRVVNFYDNVTDMVSPHYFETFMIPTYQIFSETLRGTGKILACHMDGKLAHLKKQIADSPIQLIDSLTVPPVGNVPLEEARRIWANKVIFINCPPHLTHVNAQQVKSGYESIVSEWGDKRLVIEHVEDLPSEEQEAHLSAALDALGYPD